MFVQKIQVRNGTDGERCMYEYRFVSCRYQFSILSWYLHLRKLVRTGNLPDILEAGELGDDVSTVCAPEGELDAFGGVTDLLNLDDQMSFSDSDSVGTEHTIDSKL